jgi:AcrR family transcriptional regulator
MIFYLDYLIKNVKTTSAPNELPMSPRPYRAGKRRKAAVEATRARIVEAARDLLADPQATAFTIDAIAERADVARMTVYYQFKSKAKLLEALFDDFGARANMKKIQEAFRDADPAQGFTKLIEVFCHLWKTQGALIRRLSAMAVLDPEVDAAMQERGSWRREAIARIVERMSLGPNAGDVFDLLYVLTSFETYATLAAGHRAQKDIAALLARAARALVASSS